MQNLLFKFFLVNGAGTQVLIELENPQLDIPNIVRPLFYISQNSSYFKRHLRMLPFCILENYNIREIVSPGQREAAGRGGASGKQ